MRAGLSVRDHHCDGHATGMGVDLNKILKTTERQLKLFEKKTDERPTDEPPNSGGVYTQADFDESLFGWCTQKSKLSDKVRTISGNVGLLSA